jgi:restriction system protein
MTGQNNAIELLGLFLKSTWWIFLLLAAAAILMEILPIIIDNIIYKIRSNKKHSAINQIHSDREILMRLRKMKPSEFEDYISYLFNKLGFTTEVVGKSHDGGIDIIAIKDNTKHYIQCKKFITSQVGSGDVRDFYGALVDRLPNGKGYFITTNKFTLEAERFAEDKPIELIDSYKLIKYIRQTNAENDIRLIGEKKTDKCPQCGGNLIEKNGKYGKFLGCKNYPKCNFTKS